jgi:hypothetical protein
VIGRVGVLGNLGKEKSIIKLGSTSEGVSCHEYDYQGRRGDHQDVKPEVSELGPGIRTKGGEGIDYRKAPRNTSSEQTSVSKVVEPKDES